MYNYISKYNYTVNSRETTYNCNIYYTNAFKNISQVHFLFINIGNSSLSFTFLRDIGYMFPIILISNHAFEMKWEKLTLIQFQVMTNYFCFSLLTG